MENVAVIGVGCRFPDAANPASFWQLLSNKVDAIKELSSRPFDWNLLDKHSIIPTTGKSKSLWGGFLQEVESFDPIFFKISPREAERLDPQQRLLLEVAWESLENAGIVPSTELSGSQTGVFLGAASYDYGIVLAKGNSPINAYNAIGTSLSIIANRLSYLLNLRGPSLVIDTACSSSLVALHYACQSLLSGESNLCLAGGVNLILTSEATISLSHAQMIASDSRCKTFDAAADGYVRGEGCGVVVLKRLADAIRDGDTIQAIIRGSAVNQDGLSNGLTAPNGPAQQAVIRQALAKAGVKPSQISYVETQGTGTSLGDSIEVNSLKTVLMEDREANQPCWIGSVKTNIGHLEAASGMAGLIKVVLSLQQGQIPPHLHLKQLNPYIKIKNTPIQIPTELQPWTTQGQPRLAGVSAFGFGGTNAHVILEEAPPQARSQNLQERSFHLLTLSAKTAPALQALVSRYQNYLEDHPNSPAIADICYTANTGREHFEHRLAVVVSSREQLIEQLRTFASGKDTIGWMSGQVMSKRLPKIVFLFAGEGSQSINMGRQLYDSQPVFRQAIEQCDEILRPYLERSLLEILYPDPAGAQITSSLLDHTAYTQPALFAFEYALYQLWNAWGIQPNAVMGDGVGEYVAATVAGVFSLEDGLKLVAYRSKLILMEPLPAEFAAISAQVTYHQPQIPLISNVSGQPSDQTITTSQYWVDHERQPVRFAQGIETLHQQGYQIFLEIGPKPILLEKGHQCWSTDTGVWLPPLCPGVDEWQQLLSSLGQLYVTGFKVNWTDFDRDYQRQKVGLPTYPFQRQRYWIESESSPPRKQTSSKNQNLHPLLGQKLHLAGLEKQHHFESNLSISEPAYLSDHRVFGKPVFPAMAYLEMVLAAGSNLFQSDSLILEDVNIYQALIFSGDKPKTLQVILKPLQKDIYAFEIFSLNSESHPEQISFNLHVSGRVIKGKDASKQDAVNLLTLKNQYSEEVSTDVFYQKLENQGITFGPSFKAFKGLWRSGAKTLALIQLSPTLGAEKYKIHPVLSECCLYSGYGSRMEVNPESSFEIYLPIRIERLKLYQSGTSNLWSQVKTSQGNAPDQETSISDALLVNESGIIVAEVEGLVGKRVSQQVLLNLLQKQQLGGVQNQFSQGREALTIYPSNPQGTPQIFQQIQVSPIPERLDLLIAYLQKTTGKILGFKGSQQPKTEQGLFEIGMDSLMIVELRSQIQTDLKLDLPISTFMQRGTISSLAHQLNQQLSYLSSTSTVELSLQDQLQEQISFSTLKDHWIEIEI